jgi:hypothetical protein
MMEIDALQDVPSPEWITSCSAERLSAPAVNRTLIWVVSTRLRQRVDSRGWFAGSRTLPRALQLVPM